VVVVAGRLARLDGSRFCCRKTMATQANYDTLNQDLATLRDTINTAVRAHGWETEDPVVLKPISSGVWDVFKRMENAGWAKGSTNPIYRTLHDPNNTVNGNRRIMPLYEANSWVNAATEGLQKVPRPTSGGRRTRKTRSTRRFFRRTRQWRHGRTTIKSAIRSRM
jgi:hypothetical protein